MDVVLIVFIVVFFVYELLNRYFEHKETLVRIDRAAGLEEIDDQDPS